jgi:hypothetical protein
MDKSTPKSGISSADVRDLMLEIGGQYRVLVFAEVTPSAVPKVGSLYVRVSARAPGKQDDYDEVAWRGEYFPCSACKTLTGLLFSLLWGVERDLDIRRARKESEAQLAF